MSDNTRKMSESEKRNIMEKLWLIYFNDTAYAKGVITESERNRMRLYIENRKPSSPLR